MRVLRTRRLALASLVVCAVGVGGSGVRAQGSAPQKATGSSSSATSPSAKHRPGSTHHSKSTKKTSAREKGQKAPTSDRISEIQTALSKDGSFAGNPNGKWDDATVDAMKKFQQAHGLSPSGKLDAKTLQKLGLGSQTAGVAPPTPPVSSSALSPGSAPSVPHK